MGKEKKKSNGKKNRPKPAGIKSGPSEAEAAITAGFEATGAGFETTGTDQPALQEMAQSTSSVTRATACTTYGMLFEGMKNRGEAATQKKKNKGDKIALKKLMDQNTAAMLCGMLCIDGDANVKAQAASALKSMIGALAVLDPVMIDQLSLAGLASSLVTSIQQSLEGVQAAVVAVGQGAVGGSQNLIVQTNILERSLSASVVLFEASRMSLSAFSEASIETKLLCMLEASFDVITLEGIDQIMRRAAQYIHKSLENNLELSVKVSQLMSNGVSERDRLVKLIERLSSISVESSDKLHMAAVHLAGSVVNIHLSLVNDGRETQQATAQTVASVLPHLIRHLSIEALVVMPAAEVRPEAPPVEEGFTPTLSAAEEEAQVVWTNFCARSLVVLEILNDLITGFDEEESEEEEWASDDEEGMESAAAAQGGSSQSSSLKKGCQKQCLKSMEEAGAATRLITFLESLLAIMSTHNIQLPDHLGVVAEICDVRTHSCLVLSRLLSPDSTVSCALVWQQLVAIYTAGAQEVANVGLETSGQWMPALASTLASCLESDPAFLTSASTQEVESVMTFLQMLVSQENAEVQLHGLRCVGVLGRRWCASQGLCVQFGSVSVNVLLQCLEHANPMIASHSLDALMDMFSEDDDWLHSLYLSTGTHQKITEGHASLKAKVRAGGDGLDRDAVAYVKEVLLNTSRFLKYKTKFPGLN